MSNPNEIVSKIRIEIIARKIEIEKNRKLKKSKENSNRRIGITGTRSNKWNKKTERARRIMNRNRNKETKQSNKIIEKTRNRKNKGNKITKRNRTN